MNGVRMLKVSLSLTLVGSHGWQCDLFGKLKLYRLIFVPAILAPPTFWQLQLSVGGNAHHFSEEGTPAPRCVPVKKDPPIYSVQYVARRAESCKAISSR